MQSNHSVLFLNLHVLKTEEVVCGCGDFWVFLEGIIDRASPGNKK